MSVVMTFVSEIFRSKTRELVAFAQLSHSIDYLAGCVSCGNFLDGVSGTDDSAFQDAAEHAASTPEFLAQAGPDPLHLIAGRTHQSDFQARAANAKLLSNRQAVHIQADSGDVLAQNPR